MPSPALLLGRIGDADKVFIEGCFVGSTGFDSRNVKDGWWWGTLRLYPIPEECLKSINEYHCTEEN